MTGLEDAILRTVLYADVFNFPLTLPEIHHFLMAEETVSLGAVEEALARSARLRAALACAEGYFMPVGREGLVAVRQTREAASAHLWEAAQVYGAWLARLPFVRMVALTGALAVRNAVADDDIDYLIVTTERRVWLARASAILVVRLARLRGVALCPNYVLAEGALRQERQDIFTAHELAQMIPLYGHRLYERMRAQNAWADALLPNARGSFHAPPPESQGAGWRWIKRGLEALLGGRLGDSLEGWERGRKLRRFAPHMTHGRSSARLDEQHVKGHFNDHGHPALAQYDARLRAHGISDTNVERITS
jgi:hypothetical protein